eukprot:CAMPEP_0116016462 /NCGR_PEP_ID=MMETSP0321-20121206/7497_1 /TAXON_ID=163516 /ORGANISM="Leptocylindrus danicus var. danicus, Strain B650" /LENGTH=109 /DNA_ID=CAMNT_0003486529 /DNA_START=222 /DNA_END=551 /DNA_ORIENTATION=+
MAKVSESNNVVKVDIVFDSGVVESRYFSTDIEVEVPLAEPDNRVLGEDSKGDINSVMVPNDLFELVVDREIEDNGRIVRIESKVVLVDKKKKKKGANKGKKKDKERKKY